MQERTTAIRAIFQALPIITAMKHAIAHWLNNEQWRTVRPTLKRSERVAARPVEQLTAVGFTMPGGVAIVSIYAPAALANWNPTDAQARTIIYFIGNSPVTDQSDKPADRPDDKQAPDRATGMKRGLTSYGDQDFSLFLRKAFIKGAGYTDKALNRPVIGIVNTGSAYNPCHGNMPQLIEAVKRGVMLAGGLPMDFPTISIHESFASPTSMYLRNLMSMDTEEMIRAQPMDAVVLIGGCDKTVPAQLMARRPRARLPSSSSPVHADRLASWRTRGCMYRLPSLLGQVSRGRDCEEEVADVNNQLVASVGTCSVMGTASTMACVAEALGMTVPGGASPPAVTADRIRVAEETGARAVQMAVDGLTIDKILTVKALKMRCACCWQSEARPTRLFI